MKTLHLFQISVIGLLTLLAVSCGNDSSSVCSIHGTMEDHTRDGKKIFLVPMYRPDSVGVDSTIIQNGCFEFKTSKQMMAIIRVDLRSRYGTQDLLVVTEPGNLDVKIGSISSGQGTRQNDSLQMWKERTESYRAQYIPMMQNIRQLLSQNDSVNAVAFKKQADSIHLAYKNYTRNLADNLKEGALHDFLKKMFPKTYLRKLPDGTTVTEDADKPLPL